MLNNKIIVIVSVAILIFCFALIYASNGDVNGTYYGEGDFGSIKIIVKEEDDIINYYFDFTEDYVKQLLEAKIYYLQFVANKEFNIYRETNLYTEENELLYRGVFRAHITKPFTQLNFKVGSHSESVKLKKID